MADKASYTRQAGFTPIQHEQMVLSYVRQHGRIKWAEAMELCRLSEGQVKALLKRMCQSDLLVLEGMGPASYYRIGSVDRMELDEIGSRIRLLLKMNPLKRTLIEKAGYDNGFEYVLPGGEHSVALASARHPAQVLVTIAVPGFVALIQKGSTTLAQELTRSFMDAGDEGQAFLLSTEAILASWLRRAAALSRALPNQIVMAFEQQVQAELSAMAAPTAQNTEVQRMVRQRVGQQAYRQAMLDYWGGACAVTGLALPQALRASHAKPWAECSTDAERLDVYNGFLLSANLDALFDNFLISFADDGGLLVAAQITRPDRERLGLAASMRLRWVAGPHLAYLNFHRERFASQPLPLQGADCSFITK